MSLAARFIPQRPCKRAACFIAVVGLLWFLPIGCTGTRRSKPTVEKRPPSGAVKSGPTTRRENDTGTGVTRAGALRGLVGKREGGGKIGEREKAKPDNQLLKKKAAGNGEGPQGPAKRAEGAVPAGGKEVAAGTGKPRSPEVRPKKAPAGNVSGHPEAPIAQKRAKETKEEPPSRPPGKPVPRNETGGIAEGGPTNGEIKLPALSEPGVANKLISVDFNQVDIKIFLKTISDLTGVNFLVDDSVRGTVTLMSPTKIRVGDVFKVLESVLEVEGFAAVPSGDIVKILPMQEASKRNLTIRVGNDPEKIPETDTVVTQILPLRFANVTEVSSLISPLVGTGAHVATHPETNTIIITGVSSNIYHIAKIIQELDVQGAKEELSVIRLKYASADTLSQQITQIMERKASAGKKGGRATSTTIGRKAKRPLVRSSPTSQPGAAFKILSDERTNSLIVLAGAEDTKLIHDLVKQLDIERSIESGNIHVVFLKYAVAKDLVESLSKVVQKATKKSGAQRTEPLQITADEATNSLIVTATTQEFKVLEDMIKQLDINPEQVLVELKVMEASEDALKEIGFDFASLSQPSSEHLKGFGLTNLGVRNEFTTNQLEGLAIGAFKSVGPNNTTRAAAIIKALERNSGVNILSEPHILTSNHQEATIVVADNVPFVRESRVTETDPNTPTAIRTFDFKDVGITLKITPHISQDGIVRMEIDAEFSKLVEGATGLGAETPTTSKREAKTIVSVQSGETVVIGGLMRDDAQKIERKVPILGDLPLVGNLFKVKRNTSQKTNLLLFITPHVLLDDQALAQMTEQKRAESEPAINTDRKSKEK